jgi:hypothetical protein
MDWFLTYGPVIGGAAIALVSLRYTVQKIRINSRTLRSQDEEQELESAARKIKRYREIQVATHRNRHPVITPSHYSQKLGLPLATVLKVLESKPEPGNPVIARGL